MKAMVTVGLLLCGGLLPAEAQADEGGRVRKVTTIIGSSVTIERGDVRLGKVVDLVVNEDGCIDFLVIDCDDGLVAVPWGVITYSVERRTVVITHEITRERLREVRFARDRWPDLYESRYTQRLRAAWGEKAFRHGGKAGEDRRPDRDRKPGADDSRPDRDRDRKDATNKDRKEPPDKDRKDPPVTKDRDRPPPKDKVEPPKDRPIRDKDRPKDKPKDKP